VGVQATAMSEDEDFEWPSKVPMMKLSAFLAPNRTPPCFTGLKSHVLDQIVSQMCDLKKTGVDPRRVLYVTDPQASERFQGKPLVEMSYTLARTRCPGGGYFMTAWGRFMTTQEMIKLMGFKLSCIKRSACSEREFRQMLGNSMSVPLLARLIRMILVAGKLVDPLVVADPLSCRGAR
jgi:site-specific DNA-cytosine methylase